MCIWNYVSFSSFTAHTTITSLHIANRRCIDSSQSCILHKASCLSRTAMSVPQCSYPPHGPRHQWRFANCDWMPAAYTSGQPSHPRRHPTCWISSQWSHTVSSTPCHGACTSAPLSAHPSIECKRMAPHIETLICTRRTTAHQFVWKQQHTRGAVGRSPMECGVGGQPHKIPRFHPHNGNHPWSDPPKKSLGPA